MEEISLKDLLKMLFKQKFLIIGIVIASLVLSIIYSFFIAEPKYNTQVVCEINGLNTGVAVFEQDNYPIAVTNALLEELRGPQFLDKVSKALESKNIRISGADLNKIISTSKGGNGKSIIVSARYGAKKDIAQIANTVADVLGEYSSQYLKKKISQLLVPMEKQIELEKVDAEKALRQYKEYSAQAESASELQIEVTNNEALLVQLKANLISGNLGAGKTGKELEKDILELEKKVQSQREKLLDENLKDKLYNEDLKSFTNIYSSSKQEYNRLRIAEKYLDTKSNVNILSYAEEPGNASSPDKKKIILLSLYVGMCVGVFAAFTVEYFKNKR